MKISIEYSEVSNKRGVCLILFDKTILTLVFFNLHKSKKVLIPPFFIYLSDNNVPTACSFQHFNSTLTGELICIL